ncbi:hypothetical protein POF50_009250 [Streptomyces sp. SL13]|uniref:Uncharacterized protein n=1 Tax=Streptantibioticus silvisoli TaxID=2705255 RepID=A0AA90K8J5_9ACTN|nr:hypothetical protein [Streptantibioticus silvisoli]MDI5969522.1 hypothetical protein [Streptantibioticus silvisoli]
MKVTVPGSAGQEHEAAAISDFGPACGAEYPLGVEPRGVEPMGVEPRGVEPRGVEPMGVEPMGVEPIAFARQRWRAADAFRLVALTRADGRFERGHLVERPRGGHRVSVLTFTPSGYRFRRGHLVELPEKGTA